MPTDQSVLGRRRGPGVQRAARPPIGPGPSAVYLGAVLEACQMCIEGAKRMRRRELSLHIRGMEQILERARGVLREEEARRGPAGATWRDQTGRLSATLLAGALGISEAQVAKIVGRPRQSVNKTPNAPSLQKKLEFLERVARAGEAFRREAGFRSWLRQPNRELRGESPLDMLLAGRLDVVAEFAEDLMAGNPS